MSEKRKLRLIVLDGEVTLEDLLKLKQGGFFEGVLAFEVPEGLRGQMADLKVPASPTAQAVQERADFGPPPPSAAEPPPAPASSPTTGNTVPSGPPGPPQHLTPFEAVAYGWFEKVPADVMQAYKDGAAVIDRSGFTEDQIKAMWAAYQAVQSGKRTEEQGRAWWVSSEKGTKIPPKPASAPAQQAIPATQVGKVEVLPPEPRSWESPAFIEQLNGRKYLRQIVSDLMDAGVKTRNDVFAACEKLKDRVPRIAAEGSNLRSRIDQSFAAIGM